MKINDVSLLPYPNLLLSQLQGEGGGGIGGISLNSLIPLIA